MTPLCSSCGQPHDALAFAIPTSMPTALAEVPPPVRTQRAEWDQDYCVIDGSRFFAYGSVSLPITGHPSPFIWGAWAEVSEEQFALLHGLRGVEGREQRPALNAALATDIPFYSLPTLGLPLHVVVQPAGVRPEFVLLPGEHPLVQEQGRGVSPAHVQSIAAWFRGLKQAGPA